MVVDEPHAPSYQWAVISRPDVLVLQLPPVPGGSEGRVHDAMKALFSRRGFRSIATPDDLDLAAANGCLLTRRGPSRAELLVTIGEATGASRIPLEGVDPAWLERVVADGLATVLVVDTAVEPAEGAAVGGGTATAERIRRDIDDGSVLGALVVCGDAGGAG